MCFHSITEHRQGHVLIVSVLSQPLFTLAVDLLDRKL